MKTTNILSAEIRREVTEVLLRYESSTVPVYAEAERIRTRWLGQNVALEDIIGAFVERSGAHNVSIAFDPGEARDALLGSSKIGHNGNGYAAAPLQAALNRSH